MDLLKEAVLRDRTNGLTWFCVIGSAGSVTTGAIDPLNELAHFYREEELWLHIDGVYGAMAILSKLLRGQLLPAGLANSLLLDPHKFLFNPSEAGCVLVDTAEDMRSHFSFVPSCLCLQRKGGPAEQS